MVGIRLDQGRFERERQGRRVLPAAIGKDALGVGTKGSRHTGSGTIGMSIGIGPIALATILVETIRIWTAGTRRFALGDAIRMGAAGFVGIATTIQENAIGLHHNNNNKHAKDKPTRQT